MSLIDFSKINLRYGGKQIIKDFSLSIDEGEKVLISGKSGSGKSTLLRILLGFSCFDSGELTVRDRLVSPSDYAEIRKLFAYVNQDVTLRPGNVHKVLEEIAKFSGNNYDGSFNKQLAELFEFDLELLDKDTLELSGGERQRLGIILAIMLDRPIFLLDEVTSALDGGLKSKVADFFSTCDKTVLSISHDREWAETNRFRKVAW